MTLKGFVEESEREAGLTMSSNFSARLDQFVRRDARASEPEATHDYWVETPICGVSKSPCTLENIACWGCRYPAPFEDLSNHDHEIENDELSDLGNKVVVKADLGGYVVGPYKVGLGGTPNPIETAVGTAGELDANAIANTTRQGHIFHDSDIPEGCAKSSNTTGDWKTSTWNGCSQVHRIPHRDAGGNITMRTRGYGDGPWATINDWQGPLIFEDLDEQMKTAAEQAGDNLCTSQAPSDSVFLLESLLESLGQAGPEGTFQERRR